MAEVVPASEINSGFAPFSFFCPDSTDACLLYVFEVWFLCLCASSDGGACSVWCCIFKQPLSFPSCLKWAALGFQSCNSCSCRVPPVFTPSPLRLLFQSTPENHTGVHVSCNINTQLSDSVPMCKDCSHPHCFSVMLRVLILQSLSIFTFLTNTIQPLMLFLAA